MDINLMIVLPKYVWLMDKKLLHKVGAKVPA